MNFSLKRNQAVDLSDDILEKVDGFNIMTFSRLYGEEQAIIGAKMKKQFLLDVQNELILQRFRQERTDFNTKNNLLNVRCTNSF